MRVEGITIENVRGVSGSIELDQRTLITGPMASGKSAYAVGLDFILFGYVPGSKPSEMFNNALGDTMYAKADIAGRIVERWLTQGKTLSEELAVDDNRVKLAKGNDKAMLQMALGKNPLLFDVQAFWGKSGPERRKAVLGLVADADRMEELLTAEKKARDNKNLMASDRAASDKAVEQLSRSLAEMEKPSGDLQEIEAELVTLAADIDAVQKKVYAGEANDRARAAIASSKETLPTLEARLESLLSEIEQMEKEEAANEEETRAHDEIKPTPPSCEFPEVAGELKRRIETIANFLDDLDTSDGDGDISDAVKDLRALVPDEKAIAKYTEESKAWVANNMKLSGRNNHHVGLVAQAKTTRSTLEIQITACKETIEKEAAIGPGLDQNDVATRDGFLTRKAELDASASTLRLMKVRADDIEKAKIEAGKAAEQEKAAKEKIAEAVEAQRKAVQDAEEELARRSKEFLPYGNLRILDEGKRFDLLWAKDGDTRVSRSTLSGGEQCLFDAAVARSLAPTAAVVIEAAEIDDATLTAFLTDTAEATYQLIVLTCHEPPEVPGGWKHIKMGE